MFIRVSLTNDSELAPEPTTWHPQEDVVAYLNQSPRHAVVVHETKDGPLDPPMYVLRGASEGLDNFYYGDYPAEDPGDANGGDLTAAGALRLAVDSARTV